MCRLKNKFKIIFSPKWEKGATLVEVVLILVILGISVIPLSRLAIGNMTSGGKNTMVSRAIFYAEELMEQVIADYAAVNAGRGYDWVVANWAGQSGTNPPTGLSGLVTISPEDTLNGVAYVVVQTSITGGDIPTITLETWLVSN